jgi:hypothetical protein
MTNQQILDWVEPLSPGQDVVGLTRFTALDTDGDLVEGALLLVGSRLCYVLYDDESGAWEVPCGTYNALIHPLHRQF